MTIPSGIVTYLFTDIESSTRLVQEFHDEHQNILEQHNFILKNAVESNGGFVFEIVGDGFCCAFEKPVDALKSAYKIHLDIADEFSGDIKVKVRIGIHTGKAEWNGKTYMGYMNLARTQRIMSAGHGGQTLISSDTFKSLADSNVSAFTFRDLGERRLKDLIVPAKLYQLNAENLQSDFPPLKTLDARPNNLPVQLTSFIGRESEMIAVRKMLNETKLLTLIGPGGTGKTRLSMQVSVDMIDEFDHGVWLIELASVTNSDFIVQVIARTLGIKEQINQDMETCIVNYLSGKKLLMILDNCEHMIHECAMIAERLLQKSPGLKIIATSREALKCSGETIHRVQPLSIPEQGIKIEPVMLTQYESVRLFIERALAVKADFRVNNDNAPSLSQICFRLDGIPLAIELAAARISILPVEQICEKLDNRFRLLSKGSRTALPRQQTLKALIDWSYDLLNENEKLLLQRLSIFSGGWTLEAAEEICSDEFIDTIDVIDLQTNLLDKSLISSSEKSGEIRFFLLETIKHYVMEKSAADTELKRKHFSYYKKISDYHSAMKSEINQQTWVSIVDIELSNIRQALSFIIKDSQDEASVFLTELANYWKMKGYYFEGYSSCKRLLDSEELLDPDLKATLLYNTGLLAYGLGNILESENMANQSLEFFRKSGNKTGLGQALNLLAVNLTMHSVDDNRILELYEEAISLFRETNAKIDAATAMYNISFPLKKLGKEDEALKYRLEALKNYRDLKDTYHVSLTLTSLGSFEISRGNYEKAREYTEESLLKARYSDDNYLISGNLVNLGNVYFGLKDYEKARSYFEEALLLMQEHGYKSNIVAAMTYLGDVNFELNDSEKAVYYYIESLKLGKETGIEFFLGKNLYGLGICLFKSENYEKSLKYFSFLKSLIEIKISNVNRKITDETDSYILKIKNILSEEDYERIISESNGKSKEEIIELVMGIT